MAKVLILGGVSWDFTIWLTQLPDAKTEIMFADRSVYGLGGSGSMHALILADLGHVIWLHAPVGNDEAGRMIKLGFKESSVMFMPQEDSAGSLNFTNLIDNSGACLPICTNYSPTSLLYNERLLSSLIPDADLIIPSLSNFSKTPLPMLIDSQKPLLVDLHDWDGQESWHSAWADRAD
jgi:hypothetical protein